MRFGVCCRPEDAPRFLDAGFDYVEGPAYKFAEPSFDLGTVKGLPIETTNVFFPGDIRMFSDSPRSPLAVARDTIAAAAGIGVQLMVVGSGGPRRAPEDLPPHHAMRWFCAYIESFQEIADEYGIRLAPENLNQDETNVGTAAGSLAKDLRQHGLAYTVDNYHSLREWYRSGTEDQPDGAFWEAEIPFLPAHVHMSSRVRRAPEASDPDFRAFVVRLRQLGYDERVSVEADVPDPASTLAELRRLFSVS